MRGDASFWRRAFGALLGAAATARPAVGQTRVEGVVVDSVQRPIVSASVLVQGRAVTTTSEAGRFRLDASDVAPLAIVVRRLGFAPESLVVRPGQDTALVVVLKAREVALAAQRVVAAATEGPLRLRGFYRRLEERGRGLNTGYFITPEAIAERTRFRPTQLFEAVPSIRLVKAASRPFAWRVLGRGACAMTIYVDGVRMNGLQQAASGSRERSRDSGEEFLDEFVNAGSVIGVEVYTSRANLPMGYEMLNGGCGVVLVWTK